MIESASGSTRRPALTLLTRRDCPLCEEFHAAFALWNGEHGRYALDIVDIDTDPALVARFGWRVPVLLRGDEELCAVHFRGDRLARLASSD